MKVNDLLEGVSLLLSKSDQAASTVLVGYDGDVATAAIEGLHTLEKYGDIYFVIRCDALFQSGYEAGHEEGYKEGFLEGSSVDT